MYASQVRRLNGGDGRTKSADAAQLLLHPSLLACAVPSATCSSILKKSILPPVQPAEGFAPAAHARQRSPARNGKTRGGSAHCTKNIRICLSAGGGLNRSSRPERHIRRALVDLLGNLGSKAGQQSVLVLLRHGVLHHAEVNHVSPLLGRVITCQPSLKLAHPARLYRKVLGVDTCRRDSI